MVALLVILTIIGCLVADSIVLRVRESNIVAVNNLVFAQDGGEPIESESKEVEWDDIAKED